MLEEGNTMLWPKYKCHKEVFALKIKHVEGLPNPDLSGKSCASSYGVKIHPVDDRFVPFEMSAEFDSKHKPQAGGYILRYKDGYESYSPEEAFEGGYSFLG